MTNNSGQPLSQRMALSMMNRYRPEQVKWHYEHGLLLQSIFLLGEKTNSDKYCRWVKTMYDTKIKDDGGIDTYREDEYNLDQINPGKTLFLLYKKYGEEKYRIAIEKLFKQLIGQPRTKSGGFWHKQIYPWQMWLDGLYMQGPFYAQYIAEYGGGDFEDVVHQFVLMEQKARDNKTDLLYHAWDESKEQLWAAPDSGCSPHFWGRAMGWYCMAIVDALDFIPSSSTHAGTLKTIIRRLIDPVLNYQDADTGLWYQILNMGSREKNYTESSASSMFVYFLFKIICQRIVPKNDINRIKEAAKKAYRGLLEYKIREDPSGEIHLIDTCSGAGLGGIPYRNGSYEYYVSEPLRTDDFKGAGSFILASMEYEANCALDQP